jgi:hypothetical protein
VSGDVVRIVRGPCDPITGAALPTAQAAREPDFDGFGFDRRYECRSRLTMVGEDGRDTDLALAVEVEPEGGAPWRKTFDGGYSHLYAPHGAFGTPSPRHLLVVVGSEARLVDARIGAADKLGIHLPTCVVAHREISVVAIVGLLAVVGIGPKGVAWETPRLSLDGLRVGRVVGYRLEGAALHPGGRDVPFSVDLRTGAHDGGW